MKTATMMGVNAAAALSLCACGGSDTSRTADPRALAPAIETRFEAMSGPLGCEPTNSLTPDPPDGCAGATELLRKAKDEYARLDSQGGDKGSPPDLAPLLSSYERDF